MQNRSLHKMKREADDENDNDAEDDDGILLIKGGTGPPASSSSVSIEPAATTTPTRPIDVHFFYLAVHAIKSDDNLGSLLRTAGAFGCREVLVVNSEKSAKRVKKSTRTFGAHGAERRVPIRAFSTFEKLISYARRKGCRIVGIEIDPKAVPHTRAFLEHRGPACFLPGNEGEGLSRKQIEICDSLVYVPHFGAATASLNVNAATAIVLSAFATAANYDEADRDGAKYAVVDRPFLLNLTEQERK